MGNLMKYHAGDLSQLMDRINRHSIGMDDYFDKIFKAQASNYPPYNLVQLSNTESHLEVALAGFKKEEVSVYTEYGKLFIVGQFQLLNPILVCLLRIYPSFLLKDLIIYLLIN